MRTLNSIGSIGSIASIRSGSVIAFAALALGLVACSGDAGSDGTNGTVGAPGAAGANGTNGSSGKDGVAGQTGPQGAAAPVPVAATNAPSAVYTTSNDPTENEIVAYSRAADGSLTPLGSYSTGGRGTGAGLGDQGALAFDATRKLFFAVNAGDDSISMLALHLDGSIALVSKIGSGGVGPISLTLSNNVLYVVNQGDLTHPAQISGFTVAAGGLIAIPSSTQPLSAANPAPAQIQFSPDGKILVVTEKGTNMIDTYVVTAGVAAAPQSQAATGTTPFGFAFGAGNKLIVTEAFGGGAGLGATSSYGLSTDGIISQVSKSAASTQTAPCWVTVSGSNAYVTNTGSNTITNYAIAADGTLSMMNANGVAASTGKSPADDAFSPLGDLLYTRNGGDHSLSVFGIAANGSLTKKPDFVGLPTFAAGLVVR